MSNGHLPAYPFNDEIIYQPGLTKRELFAPMAMQGMMASQIEIDMFPSDRAAHIAETSVNYADALLEALK